MQLDKSQLILAIKDSPEIQHMGRSIRFRLRGIKGDAWIVIDNTYQLDPPVIYYSLVLGVMGGLGNWSSVTASHSLTKSGAPGMRDVWNAAVTEIDRRVCNRLNDVTAFIANHLSDRYKPKDGPTAVAKPVDPGAPLKEITNEAVVPNSVYPGHGTTSVKEDDGGLAT